MPIPSLLNRRRPPRLEAIVDRLAASGVAADTSLALASFLRDAPERAVYRFNPRFLAEQTGLHLRRTLSSLAAALVAGVVDLAWEVHCPACGAQEQAFATLRSARRMQTCRRCGAGFAAHLDEEVVVTFTINAAVRQLSAVADDPTWRREVDQRLGRVTGHELMTVQAFRDLFVREPLPDSESFEVRRLALLFTDLGGSTAIYARKGDPRAYGLVREHFDRLMQVIDQAGGAIVKTIGDTVMAVFPRSDGALIAGFESQRAIAAFNRERALASDEALALKAGVHAGPCLVVTLNARLDYFGTTVNAAARVQKLARPGEVVFTAQARADLPDLSSIAELPLSEEQIRLRGLDQQTFTIYRARLS